MSRMDTTTQELFLRLGTTSQSRSVKADALFRRLRDQEQTDLSSELMRGPKRILVRGARTVEPPKALRKS
ncbi:hypothetical protein [Hyphococcus sp.]|uniref:hypothetical protein n=1 Tax=Hyphococcus sp. TaxID=2038636 RepID=UPI003CCC2AEA